MPAKSWSETLSQQLQDDLYQVYLALYKSSLNINDKQRSFEAAIDGAHSWSINEATEDALKHLCETGTCDGLQRAHRVKRKDRAIKMFEDRDAPLEQKELFEYFFSLDAVVLATCAQSGSQSIVVAKNKEWHFEDDEHFLSEVNALLDQAQGRCALSNVQLDLTGEHLELSPSLDRKRSDGHYEPGNLQIVARFINRWKSDMADDDFLDLLKTVRSV